MSKKKNTKRKLIGIVSALTGHRRYTTKNAQTTTDKLVLTKYDPIARKPAVYTETKKNLGRNEIKPRKS